MEIDEKITLTKDLENMVPQGKISVRHLLMMAIGGTIGTGLFIDSGMMLQRSGPFGALLAYIIASLTIYPVMRSLGEMTTFLPITGSFSKYATRFFNQSMGFMCGWNYWFGWAIAIPIQVQACSNFLKLWFPTVPEYVWFSIILGILAMINLFSVKDLHEFEFWLSLVKVLAIALFICTCTIVFNYSVWNFRK
jgi:lysine-specific permease